MRGLVRRYMHKPVWRATVQMARAHYLEFQILVALTDHLASRTKSFSRTFCWVTKVLDRQWPCHPKAGTLHSLEPILLWSCDIYGRHMRKSRKRPPQRQLLGPDRTTDKNSREARKTRVESRFDPSSSFSFSPIYSSSWKSHCSSGFLMKFAKIR